MSSHRSSKGLSNSTVDWADLLATTRQQLNSGSDDEALASARSHFLPLRNLLQQYSNVLLDSERVSKEDKKRLILDTRSALRVALSCSAIENEEIRDQILTEAVGTLAWHKPLLQILMSQKGDAKCRVLASQLLSNLVTSHGQSATDITSFVALSPSRDAVSDRIRHDLTTKNTEDGDSDGTIRNMEPNWVDMMLASAHANSRQSLAGVVAALHNSIVSLQKCSSHQNVPCSISTALAADRLLVSTLLRHAVPVHAVKEMIKNTNNRNEENLGDAATEWISLLLRKCCALGLLPQLFSSISGEGDSISMASEIAIYPEHIVLLQCIHSELDAPEGRNEILLGGDTGNQGVISTHLFLAELYCSLLKSLTNENIAPTQSTYGSPEWTMKSSALLVVLEILASSLGEDSHVISLARSKLGENPCTLIQTAGKHLGALLDSISYRNEGRKSRDFVMLEEEQCVITALVRLVGNVCFQCHQNQDLLRLTIVPPLGQTAPRSSGHAPGEERNALHVLLSCTSLAHSCFTLREWGVVAIRNVLDNNENNQAVVAKLEANQPIQSAELASLGIRVDMDSKGKVSVNPTPAMAKIEEESTTGT